LVIVVFHVAKYRAVRISEERRLRACVPLNALLSKSSERRDVCGEVWNVCHILQAEQLLAAERGLQTNVDLAESLDAKPTFSCPEVLLRGGGAKIVETADLIANMDSGARIENR
jgi:hypothetical protein